MSEDALARIRRERRRRRTFAIISHPDAGKTTLTEKLLLFGGAIHLAGSVKSRKARRHATSDWMKVERDRGISITTSVLQFEYQDCAINLLDTPGHQDFSEDTYRTLTAADAAVMLMDGAKGVEAQTRKLFQVCARRGIPIFTFVNKLDRYSRDPLDLMDEIEKLLGIHAAPVTWPVGSGQQFRGIYERATKRLLVFEQGRHDIATETQFITLEEAETSGRIKTAERQQLEEEIALLDEAQSGLDLEQVARGKLTPMFFGSAMHNFGIEHFLSQFLLMAPPPGARASTQGPVEPESNDFAGFVFKIQANMDPAHRDRIAFMRICAGEFERDMQVFQSRTGKKVKLTNPQQFMAQERTGVEQGYPGDIIGMFDPGHFRIGDTLSSRADVEFIGIPRFPPEHFCIVRLRDIAKRKQLKKGLDQLSQEGAIQVFRQRGMLDKDPIVGAVGALQFEVLKARLDMEYSVTIEFIALEYDRARWVQGPEDRLKQLERGDLAQLVEDRDSLPMVLIRDEWAETHLKSRFEDVTFLEQEPPVVRS